MNGYYLRRCRKRFPVCILLVFVITGVIAFFHGANLSRNVLVSRQSIVSPSPAESVAAQKPIILYLAHGAKMGHPTDIVAKEVSDQFYRLTQGKFLLKVYGDMEFGQESDLINVVQKGKLDLAIVSSGPLAFFNHSVTLLDLPYLFNSGDEAFSAWDGPPGQFIMDSLKTSGFEGVCFWENGLRSITTRNRPVKFPSDLYGLKIRVMQNPIHISFFKKIGAKPTPLPWGEVFPTLKAGIIDAQENPIPIIYYYHLEKYQQYLILTRHCYNPHIVIAGFALQQKLTLDERNLLFSCFKDARIRQRRLVTQQTDQYLQLLQAKGMKIIEPELSQFRKIGREFSKEALNNYDLEARSLFEGYLK